MRGVPFFAHVLGATLVVGWVVFDGMLRAFRSRQGAEPVRRELAALSLRYLSVAHIGFALSLLSGSTMLVQKGGFAHVPSYVHVKLVVALGIIGIVAGSTRSLRRVRRALAAGGDAGLAAEVDARFARTGMWMRLLALGFVLNFLLGLLRPGA